MVTTIKNEKLKTKNVKNLIRDEMQNYLSYQVATDSDSGNLFRTEKL